MATRYCKFCQRTVDARRQIGVGTLLLAILTGGFWLIFIPFYSKCCPICKGISFSKEMSNQHITSTTTVSSQSSNSVKISNHSNINHDAQVLFNSAVKKEQNKQYEEAIKDLKKALALQPNYFLAHYNLACYFSRLNKKEEAFKYLSSAVENGYNKFDKIQTDPDFVFLRSQPEFSDFAAGGYKINTLNNQQSDSDIIEKLERLAALKDKGILSELEFLEQKRKIIDFK